MDLHNMIMSMDKQTGLSKEKISELLNTHPSLLEQFENAYQNIVDQEDLALSNFFKMNSRCASAQIDPTDTTTPDVLVDRIVEELVSSNDGFYLPSPDETPVSNEDLLSLPENIRPQLTGTMMKRDTTGESYVGPLTYYMMWKSTNDVQFYHRFRQGLDILDLDPVLYEMIGTNPTSIGFWFPKLKSAAQLQDFFKVPETKIAKVPLPILQLTHLDFFTLTPTTLAIVDKWVQKVFDLDPNKTYFIKTGTYSSKFDFRNAKVTTPKEVMEIGQYLLFIHSQALAMAHYDLSKPQPNGKPQPSIYGVSTTNEWCVREYIEDKENLPCIYHGMPLHTEYRAFIDFDTDELLGIFPYWDSDLMKTRFSKGSDADTADMKHDYIIYCKEEDRLQKTFDANVDKVSQALIKMIPDIDLNGQWSLDIMQNGDDFWLIDMAPAYFSALKNKLRCAIDRPAENWLPNLSQITSAP